MTQAQAELQESEERVGQLLSERQSHARAVHAILKEPTPTASGPRRRYCCGKTCISVHYIVSWRRRRNKSHATSLTTARCRRSSFKLLFTLLVFHLPRLAPASRCAVPPRKRPLTTGGTTGPRLSRRRHPPPSPPLRPPRSRNPTCTPRQQRCRHRRAGSLLIHVVTKLENFTFSARPARPLPSAKLT